MLDKIFKDPTTSLSSKIRLATEIHRNPDAKTFMIEQVLTKKSPIPNMAESGFFGNVWIRKLYFPTTGTTHNGHSHIHDHLSLLVKGSVTVEIDGYAPQTYVSPTFITIKADDHHKITAIEDDTLWFCVFALRESDGKSAEEYYSDGNNPRLEPFKI